MTAIQNEQVQTLVIKILNSRAEKCWWQTKAVEDAVTWGQQRAKELRVKWDTSDRTWTEAKAAEIYETKGLDNRGHKKD